MHVTCIVHACYMHSARMLHALCTHVTCIVHACCMHSARMLHALCTHVTCIVHTCSILHTCYMHVSTCVVDKPIQYNDLLHTYTHIYVSTVTVEVHVVLKGIASVGVVLTPEVLFSEFSTLFTTFIGEISF